ncbi:MAG: hypothetical protein JNM79_23090 [Burkholderiales bacterium]|nr:hypothetical protein [Burkholderiales bacterium]
MAVGKGYELFAIPRNKSELDEAVKRSRKRLTRTAAVASAASVIPLPGLDIAVDAGALIKLIPEINREFGLTPEQIEQLSPNKQLIVYKAIVAVGGAMIGKLITRELVIEALKAVGIRLTVKQAAKYVPLAGQALSVAIGFTAMQYVGRQHIRECVRVVELVRKI